MRGSGGRYDGEPLFPVHLHLPQAAPAQFRGETKRYLQPHARRARESPEDVQIEHARLVRRSAIRNGRTDGSPQGSGSSSTTLKFRQVVFLIRMSAMKPFQSVGLEAAAPGPARGLAADEAVVPGGGDFGRGGKRRT